jgi:predicted ATP-grasp superfamily ATP-dependent carboligase
VLAANLLAPSFGAEADPRAAVVATTSLARMIALGTSGERVMADYF